jgi:hypothetical protein
MTTMEGYKVSYSSMDGSHHSSYALFEGTKVDCTTMHFHIDAYHSDATFQFVPESNIYEIHVASSAMLNIPESDRLLHTICNLFLRSIQ